MRPYFDRQHENALEQCQVDPARISGNPESVLLAPFDGRVDTLCVPEGPAVWETYDAATHAVHGHADRLAVDVEFLNAGAAATL